MISGVIVKKLFAWTSLRVLPTLGALALLCLYLTEDHDDYRHDPYSF
jgi:hypothetical protein